MAKAAGIVAVLIVLALLLVAIGIMANRPPLLRPPGPLQRLQHYLTRNVAETGVDAALDELAPVWLVGEPRVLLSAVADAMRTLGWRAVTVTPESATVRAEVVSPLFRFTDDVQVVLLHSLGARTEARIRAASRVGRGDLGANARHVMDLVAVLRSRALVAAP